MLHFNFILIQLELASCEQQSLWVATTDSCIKNWVSSKDACFFHSSPVVPTRKKIF